MASYLLILAEALGARLDSDMLPRLYDLAGVPTAQVRSELRASGLSFVDAEAGTFPDPIEIRRTAQVVTRRSTRTAAVIGAASGVAGMASIPPELAATLVLSLRLAQRLAVVHGFDPDTDAGKLVIGRAAAAAYGVQIPEFGRVATRISDLPAVVRNQLPGPSSAAAWVGQQLVLRSGGSFVGRVLRSVPGLAATVSGIGAWRRHDRIGSRMCVVFERAMRAGCFELDDVVLADEVARNA